MSKEKMANIEIDFTDEEFLQIATWAHEKDITFNEVVRRALQAAVDKELAKEEEDGTSND